jgi:hypothetical protein
MSCQLIGGPCGLGTALRDPSGDCTEANSNYTWNGNWTGVNCAGGYFQACCSLIPGATGPCCTTGSNGQRPCATNLSNASSSECDVYMTGTPSNISPNTTGYIAPTCIIPNNLTQTIDNFKNNTQCKNWLNAVLQDPVRSTYVTPSILKYCTGNTLWTDPFCQTMCSPNNDFGPSSVNQGLCKTNIANYCATGDNFGSTGCWKSFCMADMSTTNDNRSKYAYACDFAYASPTGSTGPTGYCDKPEHMYEAICACHLNMSQQPGLSSQLQQSYVGTKMDSMAECFSATCRGADAYHDSGKFPPPSNSPTCPQCMQEINLTAQTDATMLAKNIAQSCSVTDPSLGNACGYMNCGSGTLQGCSCVCANGFTGPNCNECPITCNNGGQLIQSSVVCGCKCPTGFTGAFCDVCNNTCPAPYTLNTTTCQCECDLSCSGNGTPNTNTCECQCTYPFTGVNCQTCGLTGSNCVNGVINSNTCTCNCNPNWTGASCNQCALTCPTGSTLNSTSCICVTGATGSNSATGATGMNGNNSILYIIFFGAIAIVIISAIIYFYFY